MNRIKRHTGEQVVHVARLFGGRGTIVAVKPLSTAVQVRFVNGQTHWINEDRLAPAPAERPAPPIHPA